MTAVCRRVLATACFLVAGIGQAKAQQTLAPTPSQHEAAWQLLFDGKSLNGWRASDTGSAPSTFTVANGAILVHGTPSHLYYVGPVANHDFKNFELKLDILTHHRANSGVYFHTRWQPTGWPDHGYEVQVNNSHSDPKRTAGLYDVKENYEAVAKDSIWFTLTIRVQDKRIVTMVDDRVIVDYNEPANWTPTPDHPHRRIASGTFALQGHDPESEIHYRNIRVRTF